MILEQDFIMQLRRLQRQEEAATIIALDIGNLPRLKQAPEDVPQIVKALQSLVTPHGGQIFSMTNNDQFILIPFTAKNIDQQITEQLLVTGLSDAAQLERLIRIFHMPDDYLALREVVNDKLALAKATLETAPENIAATELNTAIAGPLSSWSLHQIEQILPALDLSQYSRMQSLYRYDSGHWQDFAGEYYNSISDIQKDRFPRVMIDGATPLFQQLCIELDTYTLKRLTEHGLPWPAQKIVHLNLSVPTVLSAAFAQFCHKVPAEQRGNIVFEIARTSLLQDFSVTFHVLNLLKSEGFKVCFDGLTPNLINILRLDRLPADYYKIRATRDDLHALAQGEMRQNLAAINPSQLIFYNCDTENALTIGMSFGIQLYQGWFIDDLAQSGKR